MYFEDLGEQLVKNIAHAIRAFRLRVGEDKPKQSDSSLGETSASPEEPTAPATIAELPAESEVALELAFWESVKDGSASELEVYLEQYPDGTFASLARIRLAFADRSAAEPPSVDAAVDALDLAFWDSIKDSDRREELEAYLAQHPEGHFAGLARARLSSLTG
jgi:hypothetical protein